MQRPDPYTGLYSHQSSFSGSRTTSTLNLKVWTVDESGNFIKTYPHHPPRRHRAYSSSQLNQEQRRQHYAEIERDVKEKYFNCSSSMDRLVPPFRPLGRRSKHSGSSRSSSLPPASAAAAAVAGSSLYPSRAMTPSGYQPDQPVYQPTTYPIRTRSSVTPIRSVTAKILHKLGDTVQGSSKKKHKANDVMFDQVLNQLQQMSSQQQYLQSQVVWQQQQFKEAMDLELMARSTGLKDELEFKNQLHEQRMQRSLNRAQIQEQICSQQNKLSDHILRLQQQLDMLIEKRNNNNNARNVSNNNSSNSDRKGSGSNPGTNNNNPNNSSSQQSQTQQTQSEITYRVPPPPRPPPPQQQSLTNLSVQPSGNPRHMSMITHHGSMQMTQPPRPRTPVPTSNPSSDTAYTTRPASVPPHFPSTVSRMESTDADPDDPDEIWLNELASEDPSAIVSSPRDSLSFKRIPLSQQTSMSYECLFDDDDQMDLPAVDDAPVVSPRMMSSPETEEHISRMRSELRDLREQELDRELERKKREKEMMLQQELDNMELKMKERQQQLIRQAESELQEVLKQSMLQQQAYLQQKQLIEQEEKQLLEKNRILRQQQQDTLHVNRMDSIKPPLIPQRGRSGSLKPTRTGKNEKDKTRQISPSARNRSASGDSILNVDSMAQITSLISTAKNPIVQTASMTSRSLNQPPRPLSPQPPFTGPQMNQVLSAQMNTLLPDAFAQKESLTSLTVQSQERGRSRSPAQNRNAMPNRSFSPGQRAPPLPPERLRSPSPKKSGNLLRTRSPSPRSNVHVTFSDQNSNQSPTQLMLQQQLQSTLQLPSQQQRGFSPIRPSSPTNILQAQQQQKQQPQQLTRPQPGQPLQMGNRFQQPGLDPTQMTPNSLAATTSSTQQSQQPKDKAPPRRRSVSPYRSAVAGEAFMDHFDHYATYSSTKNLAGSRAKLIKSRSRSKEPEQLPPFGEPKLIKTNSRSAVFLDEDETPEESETHVPFYPRKSAFTPVSPTSPAVGSQLPRLATSTDDSILAKGSGRRQTLPEVIASLDIESPGPIAPPPKPAPVSGGFFGGAKPKKPPIDFSSQRKASVPDASQITKPPEGWDREKVSQMAHDVREKRMADADKKFSVPWREMFHWLFHDRLALVMIFFNACLVAYFYWLFVLRDAPKPVTDSEESDEEIVRIGPSKEKTALHHFLTGIFSRHHEKHSSETGDQ